MPNEYSWMMIRGAVLVAVSAIVVSACGGSVEFRAGAGGTAGSAAGGAPSAGASSGGASGAAAGGVGGCVNIACATDGVCGPGYKSALDASGCCTTCVPDGSGGGNSCAEVACPAIACAKGWKYAAVAGQCCGTCVPDPNACSEAASEYQGLRNRLLAGPGALSCVTNDDCQFLATNPSCGDVCASYAVNTEAAAGVEQQLSQFAADNCSFCPVTQVPCFAPPPPFCADGQCILGGYL